MKEIILSLVFGAGIILQSYCFISHKFDKQKINLFIEILFGSLIFCFILVAGFALQNFDFSISVLDYIFICLILYFIIFSVFFVAFFKKEIMPRINDLILLIYNLILIYFLFTQLNIKNDCPIFFYCLMGITILIFINSLVNIKLNAIMENVLYIWFGIIVIALTIGFAVNNFYYLFSGDLDLSYQSLLKLFIAGMTFLYLMPYLYNILLYLGFTLMFRDKDNLFFYKAIIKDHSSKIAQKYSNYQPKTIYTLSVILIFGSVLVVNYYFHFMNPILLISVLILTSSRLDDNISNTIKNINGNIKT